MSVLDKYEGSLVWPWMTKMFNHGHAVAGSPVISVIREEFRKRVVFATSCSMRSQMKLIISLKA